MSRIRILPYGASNSVSLLATSLTSFTENSVLRLNREGSAFRGRLGDYIINWGSSRTTPEHLSMIGRATIFNHPSSVRVASNKVDAFDLMSDGGVNTVEWTRDQNEAQGWLDSGCQVMVRTSLTGHSGEGIVCVSSERPEHLGNVEWTSELPQAQLYTNRITTPFREYRFHIMKGVPIFIQQKRRRAGWETLQGYSNVVRNHGNGWIYSHLDMTEPNIASYEQAVAAVSSLGLDFGAVDVITNQDNAWVLEVNTAPGLSGETTLHRYTEAFAALLVDEEIPNHYELSLEEDSFDEIFDEVVVDETPDDVGLFDRDEETIHPEPEIEYSFQEGDIVRLSQRGRDRYMDSDSNPHNLSGIIESVYDFHADVLWSNEMINSYLLSRDLELVTTESEPTPVETPSVRTPVVGDIVRLSQEGRDRYLNSRHNPHDLTGVLEAFSRVRWSNGQINLYTPSRDLEVVESAVEEAPTPVVEPSQYVAGSYHVIQKQDGTRTVGEYCDLNNGFWDTTLTLHILSSVTVIREVNINE